MEDEVNEKQVIETLKQEKTSSDINIIRGLISQNEKKIYDEGQYRLKSLDDLRLYFEQKFMVV